MRGVIHRAVGPGRARAVEEGVGVGGRQRWRRARDLGQWRWAEKIGLASHRCRAVLGAALAGRADEDGGGVWAVEVGGAGLRGCGAD